MALAQRPIKRPGALLALGLFLSLIACDEPLDWKPAELDAQSRSDHQCQEELDLAIAVILADDGIVGIDIPDDTLDKLQDGGDAHHFIRLYGGDEIRHWTVVDFSDQRCALFSRAQTTIDLATGERTRDETSLRPRSNGHLRYPLEVCRCQ